MSEICSFLVKFLRPSRCLGTTMMPTTHRKVAVFLYQNLKISKSNDVKTLRRQNEIWTKQNLGIRKSNDILGLLEALNEPESSWDIKPQFELYQIGLNQIKNVFANILMRSVNLMKDSVISLILDEVKAKRAKRATRYINSFFFKCFYTH